MCGIVGYIGDKNAQEVLLGGLKRLEYRGYDSAGIITLGKNEATRLRAKGKVGELSSKIRDNDKSDQIGIGHTRWATHGKPSEANAHPHQSGDIYLVHNGIIENYQDLRDQLKGHKFTSQTDSEVLVALIESFYIEDTDLKQAVIQALQLVEGTYGIAVLSRQNPEEIVVARKGSPLIIGMGDDEIMIASDASALVGLANNAVYLNDGELAVCRREGIELSDLEAQPLSPRVEKIEVDLAEIQKQGYDHFLLKEIMEQPTTLRSTLSGRVLPDENFARLGGLNMTDEDLRGVEHVVIVGCGTAYYGGLLASYYMSQLSDDITVEVAVASELRYKSFYMPPNTAALIVSQSGETADTLACLRELKQRGVYCLGVVNTVGSTIAREVDGGVYVHAGPEISVASTKAFTSQVAAMVIFGIQLARAKGGNPQLMSKFISELAILPDEIEKTLHSKQSEMKKLAKKFAKLDHSLYLGRDTLFPVALEGALKLKEISYIHAEGYATGELKHGPIALIDKRFFEVMLMQDNWLFEKSASGLAEINARGGNTLVITDSRKKIDSKNVVRISTSLEMLTPIVMNTVQQLFAYYVSVERGNDVDQPRNLAKSVTVE